MMESLFELLDSMKDEAISTLGELVRINTSVPPGKNYPEAVDYMARRLKEVGFEVEKIPMPRELFENKNPRLSHLEGERVNLSAIKSAGAEKTLLINTHLDVVPASGNWTVPPFDVTVQDNRIFGRGVSDSKGGIAAMLTMLSAIDEMGIEPAYNLNIAMTTDEEMGPYSGLCHLADIGKLKADYFLSMDGDSDSITIAANGNVDWQVDVYGKSYHSGSSFLGVNAIEKAIPVMRGLMELKGEIEKRRSSVAASQVIRKKTGIDTLRPVLNISIIKGGVKQNIVPDLCTLKGDRRFIPEEKFEDVCRELNDALTRVREKDPGINMKFVCNEVYTPLLTDIDHPWVREVQRAANAAAGREVACAGTHGSLDVAYAVKVTGLPACCFGTGRNGESNAHGDDENIMVDDLVMYTKFLGRLVCGFNGQP
ncbi:MAG: M20 family metallopeptidase [Candidatus Methanoperedens sp.]